MKYLAEEVRNELIEKELARLPVLDDEGHDIGGGSGEVGGVPCFIEEDGAPSPQDVGVPILFHVARTGEFAPPAFEEFRETIVLHLDLRSVSKQMIQKSGREIKRVLDGRRATNIGDIFVSQIRASGPDLVFSDKDSGHFYTMMIVVDLRDRAYGS